MRDIACNRKRTGWRRSKALFVAVDVHYLDDAGARAAIVAARDRRFSLVTWTQTAMVPSGAPYQPGEFYC
jgi:deoxyribonuclease V